MNEEIRKMMLQEAPGGVFTARLAAAEKKVRAALIQVGAKGYYPPAGQYGESLFAAAKECGETVLYESYARGLAEGAAAGAGLPAAAAGTEPGDKIFSARKTALEKEGGLLDREDRDLLERAVDEFYGELQRGAGHYYLAGLRRGIAVGELLAVYLQR